jgi:integrase
LIQLAMLTAMRRSELSGLKWSDVHEDRIVIEAHEAKTGARHEIPLTAAMKKILSTHPRTTSELAFPGRGNVGWPAGASSSRARNARVASISGCTIFDAL